MLDVVTGDCPNCGSKDVETFIAPRDMLACNDGCRYCIGNSLLASKEFQTGSSVRLAYCFNALEKRLTKEIRLCAKQGGDVDKSN